MKQMDDTYSFQDLSEGFLRPFLGPSRNHQPGAFHGHLQRPPGSARQYPDAGRGGGRRSLQGLATGVGIPPGSAGKHAAYL